VREDRAEDALRRLLVQPEGASNVAFAMSSDVGSILVMSSF
jgi:hypothetical protein